MKRRDLEHELADVKWSRELQFRAANLNRERAERAEAALARIRDTARWYADNGQRLAHEVDHALCVEVLSYAEDAL